PDQVVLVLFVVLVLQRRTDLVVGLRGQGRQVLDLRRVEMDAPKGIDFWHRSLRKRARRALHIGEPPGRRQTFLPRAAVRPHPSTAPDWGPSESRPRPRPRLRRRPPPLCGRRFRTGPPRRRRT